MIVGGQTEARASTIVDYHRPFDLGFTLFTIKWHRIAQLLNANPTGTKN